MGVVTLVVGHLTLFSVMFISIVVGIGIDYGIYYLFRYEEEIFLGRNLREALELTAARTGPGMLIGRAHRGRARSSCSCSPTSAASRSWGSSRALAILIAWVGMMTPLPRGPHVRGPPPRGAARGSAGRAPTSSSASASRSSTGSSTFPAPC